ncbi:MAG: 4Fe-4S binding protein [Clostridia bacterium]|nr:4Fe-4S binding protein [Clostridia bacterium]
MFRVVKDKCIDCGYCHYVCPFDCLIHNIEGKTWQIDESKCIQCGHCYESCIAQAIECDADQQVIESVFISNKCIGCSTCLKNCPTHAIVGEFKKQHYINQAKCIRCGMCAISCKIGGIEVTKKYLLKKKGK